MRLFKKRRIRTTLKRLFRPLRKGSRIYVGCGQEQREGFVHCDIRKHSNVQVRCSAWELDRHFADAEHIYSRDLIERLCAEEIENYLRSAYAALALGGVIEADELDVRVQAEGEEEGCTSSPLRSLLARAGFSRIAIEREDGRVFTTAKKMLEFGERQVAPEIAMVRADHRGRYLWASQFLSGEGHVCDLACGIGYGSWILAESKCCDAVSGFDLEAEAIAYAEEFYSHPKATFQVGDITSSVWGESIDVVVSFETIEHLPDPVPFLQRVRSSLRAGGKLFCSTPNQTTMPFKKERFPYHVRHFTPDEFRVLLEDCGFEVLSMHSQHDVNSEGINDDEDGLFLLAIATPLE